MIDIKIDGLDYVIDVLKGMQEQLQEFGKTGIPVELTTWQTDDMKRNRPNTEMHDDKTAVTYAWPRGRFSLAQRPAKARMGMGGADKPIKIQGGRAIMGRPPTTSGRPIVRESLWGELVTRMHNAMVEQLKWRKH